MRKRPNILLITTDQQRADHIGLERLPGMPTPHLDRLGREGLHCRRGYTCCPICTPARVSLLTGTYPSRHGAYTIGVTADPEPSPSVAELLGEAGYATALFGKSHFVARKDEARDMLGDDADGADSAAFRKWSGPYRGFQEFQGSDGHTINANVNQHYRVWLEEQGVDFAPHFPKLSAPESYDHHACGPWDLPAEYHTTRWIGDLTADFIERKGGETAPWFCWASFEDPHEPFVCPEPWYSAVDAGALEPFEGYREGEFDDRHPVYRDTYENQRGKWKDEAALPCLQGKGAYQGREREALRATAGMIGFIAEQVGRMLGALEKTGQADNTLVVFTSDHGELHGHHGLWGKGVTAHEDAQRVPFLVWGPGLGPARGTTDALVNLVDLPRTFLGLAGIAAPQGMQGADLGPLLRGERESVRDCTLVECRPVRHLHQHTLITDRHKLVVYNDWEGGELYDLHADPDQYRNLWAEPSSRDTREALLLRLARFHADNTGEALPRRAFA